MSRILKISVMTTTIIVVVIIGPLPGAKGLVTYVT